MIYLDYAATTPVDDRVAKKMMNYLTIDGVFANPASRSHGMGWQAEEAVEDARYQIAEAINASPLEIVFTSGATESDNLAIKGVAHAYQGKAGAEKGHIITSQIEHKAVLDTCQQLESEGYSVTYLAPQEKTGIITPEQVQDAIRDDTILVSLMMVNNEIGTITDVSSIGEMTRKSGVLFHVDGAQAFGKVSIDLAKLHVDLMSFSAHKAYAPKGIGALYVRRQPKVKLEAQIHGGGHERGMRSGTLPTHQIVAMGEAFEIAVTEFDKDHAHITKLKQKFWHGIKDIEGIQLNSTLEHTVPNIINVAFQGQRADELMMKLNKLAVSSGSACNSKTVAPSYVLKGIGLKDELALGSIRFSFGRFTTENDVDVAVAQIKEALN